MRRTDKYIHVDKSIDSYVNNNTHAQTQFFTHTQRGRRNGCVNFSEILHIDSLGGLSDTFETASEFVHGFGRVMGAKFSLCR